MKKMLPLLVIGVLVLSGIGAATITDNNIINGSFQPQFEIDIKGIFGLTYVVTNTGDQEFELQTFEVIIDAPIVLFGKSDERQINTMLPPQESLEIPTGLVFGFGFAAVEVSLMINGEKDSRLGEVFLFGPFMIRKKAPLCFAEGTKITMVDGSNKNIEDVKAGDFVFSYNPQGNTFSSWMVTQIGTNMHWVYDINDGLILTTITHPVHIKKTDGRTGLGAIDNKLAKQGVSFYEDIMRLEVSDQLLTLDGEWIEITSIHRLPEPMRTYNIMSSSGTRTFFANNILVYEENF